VEDPAPPGQQEVQLGGTRLSLRYGCGSAESGKRRSSPPLGPTKMDSLTTLINRLTLNTHNQLNLIRSSNVNPYHPHLNTHNDLRAIAAHQTTVLHAFNKYLYQYSHRGGVGDGVRFPLYFPLSKYLIRFSSVQAFPCGHGFLCQISLAPQLLGIGLGGGQRGRSNRVDETVTKRTG